MFFLLFCPSLTETAVSLEVIIERRRSLCCPGDPHLAHSQSDVLSLITPPRQAQPSIQATPQTRVNPFSQREDLKGGRIKLFDTPSKSVISLTFDLPPPPDPSDPNHCRRNSPRAHRRTQSLPCNPPLALLLKGAPPHRDENGMDAPSESATDLSPDLSETDSPHKSAARVSGLPNKSDADPAELLAHSVLAPVGNVTDSQSPALNVNSHRREAGECLGLTLTSTDAMSGPQTSVTEREALMGTVDPIKLEDMGKEGREGEEGPSTQALVNDSGLELPSLELVVEEEEGLEETCVEPMDCRSSPDPPEGAADTLLHQDSSTLAPTPGEPENRPLKDCKTLEGASRHLNLDNNFPFRALDGPVESLSNGWGSPISNGPQSSDPHDNNNGPITRPIGWGGGINGYHPAPTSTLPTPFDSPSPEYDEVISCSGCCLAGLRLPSLCIRTPTSRSTPAYKNLNGDSTANQGLLSQAPPTSKLPPLNAQKNV